MDDESDSRPHQHQELLSVKPGKFMINAGSLHDQKKEEVSSSSHSA